MRFRAALWAVALVATARPAFGQVLAQATPVKYNLTVRPGEPVVRDVAISNLGPSPVVVRVRLSDWRLDELGALSLAPLGTTANTLDGHVVFEPETFSLQPGETGHVTATLSLPADGPATRWGVLLSEVRPAVARSSTLGPRANAELGTTLYLSRAPQSEIRPEIVGLDLERAPGDSLAVSVRVANPGARHFYVAGQLAVLDSAGRHVAEGPLPTGVVLPGARRTFHWSSSMPLPPGHYLAQATLDTGQPELLVGEMEFSWPLVTPVAPPLAGRTAH